MLTFPFGNMEQVEELLIWGKRVKQLAKVGLSLASIALQVCIDLAIATANFEAACGATACDALSTCG